MVDQVQESSVDLDPPPRPLLQRKLRDIFLDVASAPPGQEGRSLARGCVKYIDASSAEEVMVHLIVLLVFVVVSVG